VALAAAPCGSVRNFDEDDIIAEQLTRNVQFFGLDNQKRIAHSFVVVVGLGVRTGSKLLEQYCTVDPIPQTT
jgi:tRNA A37 threonylcarbamoyladenosine dehydratase